MTDACWRLGRVSTLLSSLPIILRDEKMTRQEVWECIKQAPEDYNYCYILYKPSGQPFYVGIGKKDRIKDHETYLNSKNTRNPHKDRTIRKILEEGGQVDYRIHCFSTDWEFLKQQEIELIAKYGRNNYGGILCNITAGGDGALGRKASDSQLSKMREASLKLWQNPAFAENKKQQAIKQMAKQILDPEYIALASENSKRMWQDENHRENMRVKMQEVNERPEVKRIKSERAKAMWQNPQTVANILNGRILAKKRKKRKQIIQSVLKTGKLHEDFIPLVLNRLKEIIQNKINKGY